MSSQERKERRLKQQIKEGAAAIALVKSLEGDYNKAKDLLDKAMSQLVELQDKYNELNKDWAEARAEASRFKASNGILERDNEQLMAANQGLRTSLQELQRKERAVRKELREVKKADKEPRKLRQRLATRAKEIDKLQFELSKLKKERAEAW